MLVNTHLRQGFTLKINIMLKNDRITLRPLKKEDRQYTLKWRNDPEIKQASMMHPFPVTLELEDEWYEGLSDRANKAVWFGIELNQDSSLIGFTFLNNISWTDRTCNLGIVIGEKNHQGAGIGREVMETLISYAFEKLNLRKIGLEVREDNKAALSLYEKLGFMTEGTLRDHHFSNGKYYDVLIMSLFKKDEQY